MSSGRPFPLDGAGIRIGDVGVVEPPRALPGFVSFASRDNHLRAELEHHLWHVRQADLARFWHVGLAARAEDMERESMRRLEESEVILLLLSSYYMDDDTCWRERVRALKRLAEEPRPLVLPILIRPLDLKFPGSPLADIQILPKNEKAVTEWSNRDQAWKEVASSIREALGDRGGSKL